jgi:hypothetical protein
MQIAIRKPDKSQSTRSWIGTYAEVCFAINELGRALVWQTPREASYRSDGDGGDIRVGLVLGSKSRPDHVIDLYARLAAQNLSEELMGDVFSSIFLPNERVYEVIFTGVADPPERIIAWAWRHGWQVEEYPAPGRFWPVP